MPEVKDILVKVFLEVAEQMAFLFGEEADEDALCGLARDIRVVKMCFKGPFSGTLTLVATSDLCHILAENMLGVDADDERAVSKALDAVKELLNVTCGRVLTAVAGEVPVFDLTVPEVLPVLPAEVYALKECGDFAVCLLEEDHTVLLIVKIEPANH